MNKITYTTEAKPVSTGRSDQFRTTHWSVVLAAGRADSPEARQALEKLCQIYWYPLYAFVRRKGHSPQDAEDLTQEFFLSLLKRNDFGGLSPDKGLFRAFLLTALKHFLCDQYDRNHALKRGGGKSILSLDAQTAEDRYRLEPADTMSPDKMYDRVWAYTVMENARDKLRKEYALTGKSDTYHQLKLLEPGAENHMTCAELAKRRGISENTVKSWVKRSRERYGELILEEISQTVAGVAQVDEEWRSLFEAIQG